MRKATAAGLSILLIVAVIADDLAVRKGRAASSSGGDPPADLTQMGPVPARSTSGVDAITTGAATTVVKTRATFMYVFIDASTARELATISGGSPPPPGG